MEAGTRAKDPIENGALEAYREAYRKFFAEVSQR